MAVTPAALSLLIVFDMLLSVPRLLRARAAALMTPLAAPGRAVQ